MIIQLAQLIATANPYDAYVKAELGGAVFTYAAPAPPTHAQISGPTATFEKLAAGFWPIPRRIRLEFAAGARETWSGTPVVSSALGASLRWRYLDLGWMFADLGVIAQVHAPNPATYDVGGTAVVGLRAGFGSGWSGTLEVHAPAWIAPRFVLSVTPLATLSYRF